MVPRLLALVLLSAAPGAAAAQAAPHDGDGVAYNRWSALACHNCFEPGSPLGPLSRALTRTRAVEIDIWPSRNPGEWLVAHDDPRGNRVPVNESNCVPGRPGAGGLHECLRVIRDHVARNRTSEVVTVFLDLKEDFQPGWGPADLDGVLTGIFDKEMLFTPQKQWAYAAADRSRRGPTSWPTLAELHGRVIIVLTGDNDRLRDYLRSGHARDAFVALRARSDGDVRDIAADTGIGNRVLFLNIGLEVWFTGGKRMRAVDETARAGRMVRMWHFDYLRLESASDRYLRKLAACSFGARRVHFLAVYGNLDRVVGSGCGARAPVPGQALPRGK